MCCFYRSSNGSSDPPNFLLLYSLQLPGLEVRHLLFGFIVNRNNCRLVPSSERHFEDVCIPVCSCSLVFWLISSCQSQHLAFDPRIDDWIGAFFQFRCRHYARIVQFDVSTAYCSG